MTPDFTRVIESARAVAGEFKLRGDFTAGSVGAAVLAGSGRVYTGICIDLACGLGICAEVAALAEMLKARETQVIAVAAIDDRGNAAVPCGRCRETIAQLDPRNLDCTGIVANGEAVPLRDLLPQHWLSE